MTGQFMLVTLFLMALVAGVFFYFSPKQPQAISPLHAMTSSNDDPMTEDSNVKRSQQLDVSTNNGVVQVSREMDGLVQEQKRLKVLIGFDQEALNNTNKEIADVLKQQNVKDDKAVSRLKELELELQNDKQLLVAHGQTLLDLNDKISKQRQLISEDRDQVNINTASTLRSLQGQDSGLNDQSAALIDKVKQQNDDSMRHTQDMIDEERQRMEDQQNR